ncbi:nitrate ABC transporter ATP-binding protein [Tychonema sp. LEGE 07203]|uniref:nitrate ABC transporter ATP-binding protein n=1 Tax=Tychonema sp. LEGE 07203 TaxID=1828671 RepID=UPI0018824859|nr:nitrate ABC transporter ATP-binding protein [Tychonema sp. LEGE 07203]MBE9096543.1 ATP-binding cassette domain-containing protein [Tychonema sp. LEGE 07203]
MQTLTTPETTNLQRKKPGFLTLENVSKVYPNQKNPEQPFVILDGVNLTINEGEFICLIGHSGCGKSTLLNTIAGFNQPTNGEVALEGSRITEPGPDRMVVFQNYSLLPWLTATENIHLGVESVYADKSAEEHNQIVKEHLELVGLTEACNKRPGQLSGGMKQRVAIARALATKPKLLILDEPFGALDPITREELQEELLKIWREHKITVIMITHDIDEALFLADRIVMMTNGPAASIGEDMHVPFSRPRNRTRVMEDPKYYELRNFALEFLFSRYAHHEEDEATDSDTETVAVQMPLPVSKKSAVADKPMPPVSFTPHATQPVEATPLKGGILAVSCLVAVAALAAINMSVISSQKQAKQAETAPQASTAAVVSSPPSPAPIVSPAPIASPASGISDQAELDAIEQKLYAQIDESWRTTPTFTESLTYRVKVKQNGDILQFDPTNQAAKDFVKETPLPVLQTPAGAAASAQKTAEFQVTFRPTSGGGGVLEVKPGK